MGPTNDSRLSVLIASWGGGGNLPPLLAAGSLLAERGHQVRFLASAATRGPARELAFDVLAYGRGVDPDERVSFEAQAEAVLATVAGRDIAFDVRDAVIETDANLVVADCMLPAALVAARALRRPSASLVHFLYGTLRAHLLRGGGWWAEQVPVLNATCLALGVPPFAGELAAWEAPELMLVTAPRWFDRDLDYPARVIHAGPLGIRRRATAPTAGGGQDAPPCVLLSFSTTVMDGQPALIQRACDAIGDLGVDAILTLGNVVPPSTVTVPSNVEILSFADHDALLPHCAAVVSHGGLGTVLRALAHGVPMVLLPLGREQPVNADRVAALGAGIHLDADSPPREIRASLERLLADPAFSDAAAAAAQRIAADEPDRAAVEALEQVAASTR